MSEIKTDTKAVIIFERGPTKGDLDGSRGVRVVLKPTKTGYVHEVEENIPDSLGADSWCPKGSHSYLEISVALAHLAKKAGLL